MVGAKSNPVQKEILVKITKAEAYVAKMANKKNQNSLVKACVEAGETTLRALWAEYNAAA